jgi:hypothetical protein
MDEPEDRKHLLGRGFGRGRQIEGGVFKGRRVRFGSLVFFADGDRGGRAFSGGCGRVSRILGQVS